MVVVVEPAVKGCGAFSAGCVDRAVGPAAEHGADEAFGFSVGLRAPRAGAEVSDSECAAGDGVDGRAVGRAVVGQDAFDGDAVAGIERQGAAQEPDRGAGLFVGENFGVGQASRVVDGDVHEVPAGFAPDSAGGVGERAGVVRVPAEDPLAGAALDAPELLTSMWISSPGRARS